MKITKSKTALVFVKKEIINKITLLSTIYSLKDIALEKKLDKSLLLLFNPSHVSLYNGKFLESEHPVISVKKEIPYFFAAYVWCKEMNSKEAKKLINNYMELYNEKPYILSVNDCVELSKKFLIDLGLYKSKELRDIRFPVDLLYFILKDRRKKWIVDCHLKIGSLLSSATEASVRKQ